VIHGRIAGELSKVPYAEPTWLSPGYYSPYYSEGHRKFQLAVRHFFDAVVYNDATVRLMKRMANGHPKVSLSK